MTTLFAQSDLYLYIEKHFIVHSLTEALTAITYRYSDNGEGKEVGVEASL